MNIDNGSSAQTLTLPLVTSGVDVRPVSSQSNLGSVNFGNSFGTVSTTRPSYGNEFIQPYVSAYGRGRSRSFDRNKKDLSMFKSGDFDVKLNNRGYKVTAGDTKISNINNNFRVNTKGGCTAKGCNKGC